MEKTGWKILAIIFMILFLLQLLLFVWVYSIGVEIIEKETECAYNVCSSYSSYFYDEYTEVCSCYEESELIKVEYIK